MMYFVSMKEPHPEEVSNNCMQPSKNDHTLCRLLSVPFIVYLDTLSAKLPSNYHQITIKLPSTSFLANSLSLKTTWYDMDRVRKH